MSCAMSAKNMYDMIVFGCVVQDRLLKPLGGYAGYNNEWRELGQVISRVSLFLWCP